MESLNRKKSIVLCLLLVGLAVASVQANECDNWQTLHPEWIFCDDFESDTAMVRDGRYFEYDNDSGDFILVAGVGLDASKGMRTIFQAGEVGAGNLLLGFGRNPVAYMNKGIRDTEDFRDIYYRMYLKMQPGWVGSPGKLSRATSFASLTSWAQAMIAHLWSSGDYLLVDPASGVENGVVVTRWYNDFENLHWLGNRAGVTPIFDSLHDDTWYCIEHHIKLNDPGQSNGVQEFWIDGNLEASKTGLNFVDTWTDYAINAVFFENYWNNGSVQLQERYFDNIVVSTQPIGPAVNGGELIAHWNFDEGTGNTAYDSAGANHGTLMNGPQWATGQIDGALRFDGDNDYVGVSDSPTLEPQQLTIGIWVSMRGPGTHSDGTVILGKGRYNSMPYSSYQMLHVDDIDKFRFRLGFTDNGFAEVLSYEDYDELTDTNWYHIAGTYDGQTLKLYINGLLSGSHDYSGTIEYGHMGGTPPTWGIPAKDLTIGVWAFSEQWKRAFNGIIDDVRIYDRALSAEEVEQLYQDGVGELVSLEIVGPNEVAEDSQAQYKAIVHYERADVDVTDSADWSVEPNDIADIDAGLLETEEIDKPQDVTITAEYTEGDITEAAQKQVSVLTICPSGSALEFDGQDDYVDCGNNRVLQIISGTVSAWIKTCCKCQSTDGYCGIVVKQQAYGMFIKEGNFAVYNWGGGGLLDSGVNITDDKWHHVVFSFQSNFLGETRLYVDGLLRHNGTLNISNQNKSLLIGYGDAGNQYFNGLIDDVRIYDRALSAEEIRSLMNTRPDTDKPNLVAYWDFDEGDGEIAGDSSVNGNDGTLVGAAWVESDAPIGICTPVAIDIKPGSCPNPLNLESQGVLPVAILGSQDFDVGAIDAASIFLEGVPAIRSSYEDVASPVTDGGECECSTEGPDGYTDLTLKFRTQDIVEKLIYSQDELAKDQTLALTLTGELFDDTGIEGTDCVVLVGNVPKWLAARRWDANGDGVVNMADFAFFAENWLQAGGP